MGSWRRLLSAYAAGSCSSFRFDNSRGVFLSKCNAPGSNSSNPSKPKPYAFARELYRMRQDKRRLKKKNSHSGVLALTILVVVFVGLAFLVASPPSTHSAVQSIAPAGQPTPGEDAFYGSIDDPPFAGQTTGVVKADTNCKPVEKGLTNCIGIITAADGAELHFNYTHDMSTQPCLTAGDQVTVMLLSDGTVKVVRG